MESVLKEKKWLKRVIEVTDENGVELLTYSGRGIGTEKIKVGDLESKGQSELGWFVPKFELTGNSKYKVEVRIWPWLTIRSLTVERNGKIIYSEGSIPYEVSRFTEIAQLCGFLVLLVGPPYLLLLVLNG